jgi:hypothetical protein
MNRPIEHPPVQRAFYRPPEDLASKNSGRYPEAACAPQGIGGALRRVTEELSVHLQRWTINRQFRAELGYTGDFDHPKSFEEKIQFRKLYGNHAFYASMADKFLVRDYVATKVGSQHLIPLLGAYDHIQPSDFDPLPQQFIVKANHGCKWNQIVLDKGQLDPGATVRQFNRLCLRRFGWERGERHYNFIRPKIVIEELLLDDEGRPPWEYNFLCFHGPNGFDFVYTIQSPADHDAWAVIASDGRILAAAKLSDQELAARSRPTRFAQMVEVAEALSSDFDFVRVDLYFVHDQVFFGELTCTPRAGYTKPEDQSLQQMRDAMWHLDAGNPRLYVRGNPMSAWPF